MTLTVDGTTAAMEIRDDGNPPTSTRPLTSGNGLTGLTERLIGSGGTLEFGHLPGGGYRLHARIPLEPS